MAKKQEKKRLPRREPGNSRTMSATATRTPRAVLFDRDGTLVGDVPYNGDPDRVTAMPTAALALRMLRAAGIPVGVVTNQSGIGRGIFTESEVGRVNRGIDDLLGPFDAWQVCPHIAEDDCRCRKPRPGMILAAADEGCDPREIDGRLRIQTVPDVSALVGRDPYVVLHPGAAVPARAWPASHYVTAARLLADAGVRVLVTGGPGERDLTATVAGDRGCDLGGRTDLATLAGVLAGASVVAGNTGPAHLAAEVPA